MDLQGMPVSITVLQQIDIAENHRKLRADVLELELGDAKDSRGRSVSGDIGQTTTGAQGGNSRTGPVSSNASKYC